jgi:hypothetical protein
MLLYEQVVSGAGVINRPGSKVMFFYSLDQHIGRITNIPEASHSIARCHTGSLMTWPPPFHKNADPRFFVHPAIYFMLHFPVDAISI